MNGGIDSYIFCLYNGCCLKIGDLGVEKVLVDLVFWCNKSGENCSYCADMSDVLYKVALEDSFDVFVQRSVQGQCEKDGEVIHYIRCHYFDNLRHLAELVFALNEKRITERVFELENEALTNVLGTFCASERGDANLAVARWWIEYLRDLMSGEGLFDGDSGVSLLGRMKEKYKEAVEYLKGILK